MGLKVPDTPTVSAGPRNVRTPQDQRKSLYCAYHSTVRHANRDECKKLKAQETSASAKDKSVGPKVQLEHTYRGEPKLDDWQNDFLQLD